MKYKIIVDKQSRLNPSAEKKEYEIDIEELRFKGEIHDSLVITKDEDYVMRRLKLTEFYVLEELETPIKEPISGINIELFEGDNYIYLLDMTGNKFYAEYLIKSNFNDTYPTRNEMHSAIDLTAQSIELSVNQKLNDYSTIEEMNAAIQLLSNSIELEVAKKVNNEDYTAAQIFLKINNDESEAKISADKIALTATKILNLIANNELNLTSNNMTIKSTNFNVDKDGKIECTNGVFNGGNIELIGSPGLRYFTYYKDNNKNDSYKTYLDESSFGIISGNARIDIVAQNDNYADSEIHVVDSNGVTNITGKKITTPLLEQTSQEKEKKNFEKLTLDEAKRILQHTDIYKYNLKSQRDGAKKHIGFVIGDQYNYAKEITSEDNKGVDNYSMTSILYPIVKEQQKMIDQLLERVKTLEEKK